MADKKENTLWNWHAPLQTYFLKAPQGCQVKLSTEIEWGKVITTHENPSNLKIEIREELPSDLLREVLSQLEYPPYNVPVLIAKACRQLWEDLNKRIEDIPKPTVEETDEGIRFSWSRPGFYIDIEIEENEEKIEFSWFGRNNQINKSWGTDEPISLCPTEDLLDVIREFIQCLK